MYRKRKQAYHYFNETAPCDEIIQPEIETIPAVDENVIKSLIPIISTKHENEEVQGVDARQLHEFLGSKQDFSTWIKSRIEQYDFMQGIDFIHTPQIYGTSTGAVKRDEYTLTIEMAKELSMVERTERGKQARKYFIECEKIAKGQLTTTAVQTADIVPAQPIQPAPKSQPHLMA